MIMTGEHYSDCQKTIINIRKICVLKLWNFFHFEIQSKFLEFFSDISFLSGFNSGVDNRKILWNEKKLVLSDREKVD